MNPKIIQICAHKDGILAIASDGALWSMRPNANYSGWTEEQSFAGRRAVQIISVKDTPYVLSDDGSIWSLQNMNGQGQPFWLQAKELPGEQRMVERPRG